MSDLIPRIDNLFFNTTDVSGLAGWYSTMLGIPVRRTQIECDQVMWSEIGVGGMELSFRLADGAAQAHPEIRSGFVELPPGSGATISYEVKDTAEARRVLLQHGATAAGPTVVCTDGKELITAYRDPAGVIFQTYEARFTSPAEAVAAAKRASSAFASDFGLNIRDVRGLGLGATVPSPDPERTSRFLTDAIGADPVHQEGASATLKLDRAYLVVEEAHVSASPGSRPAIEVLHLDSACDYLGEKGLPSEIRKEREAFRDSPLVASSQAMDYEGNPFELWQRNG